MMLRDEDGPWRRQEKLERINEALLERLSRIENRRGSGWAAFQAAAALEKEVAVRNRDLEAALRDLSERNRELALARAAADAAVKYCPTHALSIQENPIQEDPTEEDSQ